MHTTLTKQVASFIQLIALQKVLKTPFMI